MKIKKIEVYHIKIPLKNKYKLSKVIGTICSTEPIIIRIITDNGIVGIGEADPLIPFTEETPETIKICLKKYIGPLLIEKRIDPSNITKIHEEMDKTLRRNFLSKAAIDIACFDILGKNSNLPVYKLLGGALRENVPISTPSGIAEETISDDVNKVLKNIEKGIDTFMIKMGNYNIKTEINRLSAIRNISDKIHIIIDANQGWDCDAAIKFGRLAEKYNIDFLEQPVQFWDLDGLLKIRKSINIPISVDESLFSIYDAINILKKDAADIFSIKISKNGGIYKAKQIIDLAKVFGIKCYFNSMIEGGITQSASLNLAVNTQNILDIGQALCSTCRLEEDITNYSENILDNIVKIREKPGLGIILKMGLLKKYLVDMFEIYKQ